MKKNNLSEDNNIPNYEEIIDKLIKELKTYPGGTEISTYQLLKKLFPEQTEQWDTTDFFEIHFLLQKRTKKCGLLLDMSKHRDCVEGFPYQLDFAVYQKKPGTMCFSLR